MGFQVQDGSWVQAFASPLVGNHTKMAGKEYKSKQIRGFNFCMTKGKKKKKCGQEMSQKKSRRSCTRGSHRKDGSPPPCRTLDGSVQQDFSVSVLLICGARSWMHTGTSSCIHVPSRNNQKRLQAMPNAPSGPNLPGWELLFFITYSKYILNTSCLSDTVLATGDQKKLINQKILALIICSSETR